MFHVRFNGSGITLPFILVRRRLLFYVFSHLRNRLSNIIFLAERFRKTGALLSPLRKNSLHILRDWYNRKLESVCILS